jgi:hypothetical protein
MRSWFRIAVIRVMEVEAHCIADWMWRRTEVPVTQIPQKSTGRHKHLSNEPRSRQGVQTLLVRWWKANRQDRRCAVTSRLEWALRGSHLRRHSKGAIFGGETLPEPLWLGLETSESGGDDEYWQSTSLVVTFREPDSEHGTVKVV